MTRAILFPLIAALGGTVVPAGSAAANGNVHVTRFWHNHQPIYWPEWNTNGGQTARVEYAWDSIQLKFHRAYGGSSSNHPENNLGNIFGLDDRRNAYQGGPRQSLASFDVSGGFAMSYSGSLIDNVRQLGSLGQLGYGSGWADGNREARGWTTPAGAPRLDLVGFAYHHSLGPLLPKEVFRKEIQIFRQAWWKAWGGNADLSDHSKGFFPTEMAFSRHMVDVLREEGYEWVIVASHHLSRTCPTYLDRFDLAAGDYGIFSSPPNRADLLGPSPTEGWWYSEPNPGNAAWNVAPFAYQLHRAQYIDPETGEETTIVMVPSDDVLSYRYGYADEGIGKIGEFIAPHADDPERPVLVMPATDGDNAWGGGSSSWMEATPRFFDDSAAAGYVPTTPQDFVDAHGAAAPVAHVEDGAWIFPTSDYGSPYFLKWIEPPLGEPGGAANYPGTLVDLETPGFALKFWSWAPVVTGANWVETAEQILRDEGGSVEAWKIQAPYDWDGSWTGPNAVELAWHIYLAGLDSGFNYYGGLGNDDEVKPALATTRAIQTLRPWLSDERRENDRTAPTVLKPQRFPHNPGGYTFGWFNAIPGGDARFLKEMPSEFYVWTHAYDLSGVESVVLRVRVDGDGWNPLDSTDNETYAGGPEVGEWVSLPMTRRPLPATQESLNAAADNAEINYFVTPPELADYYYARIDGQVLPGFRGKLLDYYVEAVDGRGNRHRSEIQHVFVEDDGAAVDPPAAPSAPVAEALAGPTVRLDWDPVPGATGYRIYRDGAGIASVSGTSYLDSDVDPETAYVYAIGARNAAGESAPGPGAEVATGPTLPEPPPFVLDGGAPAGYRLSAPGMVLHAAVRGTRLYVATWFADPANGNDHFVVVADSLEGSVETPFLPAWGKAGLSAAPPGAAVLCMESTNGWTGWQRNDSAGSDLGGSTEALAGGQLEGVLDLVEAFGALPAELHLAAVAVQTESGGVPVAQAPAGNGDGSLDPGEFLHVSVEGLSDADGDETLDRLDPEDAFRVEGTPRPDAFRLRWPVVPGRTYRLLRSTDLVEWTPVPGAGGPVASGEEEQSHDAPVPETPVFYRVTAE